MLPLTSSAMKCLLTCSKPEVLFVTFETDGEPGDIGCDGVRFKFAAEGPEGATVTFKAVDSNNDEYTFTNEGYGFRR